MKYHILLLLPENEVHIQEVKNHDSVESIMDFMFKKSGATNYFISESGYRFYQIVKGNLKQFGFNYGNKPSYLINQYTTNFMLMDLYPQILNHPLGSVFVDPVIYRDYLDIYKQLSEKLSNKQLYIEKWKYKLPMYVLKNMYNIDPTPTKKYFDWLCSVNFNYQYILKEDYEKVTKLLFDFDKPEVKALIKKAGLTLDINNYESDKDLFETLNKCFYSRLTDLELKDINNLVEARKVYEDDRFFVVVPKSHEESVKLSRIGGFTNWCTAVDNINGLDAYDEYTNNGTHKLPIIINKENNNKKYQLSTVFEESVILDQNDNSFDVEAVFGVDFMVKLAELFDAYPYEFQETFLRHRVNLENLCRCLHIDLITVALIKDKSFDLSLFLEHYDWNVRSILLDEGLFMQELIDDVDFRIRKQIADMGYGLDILINDEDARVRAAVIRQGYGLFEYDTSEDTDLTHYVKKCKQMIKEYNLQPTINEYGFTIYDAEIFKL